MSEPDNSKVAVAPEYQIWAESQQRAAKTRELTKAEREAIPPDIKAANARLEAIGTALSDATRWRILLELGKGDALPVGELARRTGKRPDSISKHMALLRKAGLVEKVFSTCYQLPAAMEPAPGATTIDLGPCLLKLTIP